MYLTIGTVIMKPVNGVEPDIMRPRVGAIVAERRLPTLPAPGLRTLDMNGTAMIG
jgi:hypothetical protein